MALLVRRATMMYYGEKDRERESEEREKRKGGEESDERERVEGEEREKVERDERESKREEEREKIEKGKEEGGENKDPDPKVNDDKGLQLRHFQAALRTTVCSVSQKEMDDYDKWARERK
jgi:hypothetical protein